MTHVGIGVISNNHRWGLGESSISQLDSIFPSKPLNTADSTTISYFEGTTFSSKKRLEMLA